MARRRTGGFTLIETQVAIVIALILMFVALPAVSSWIQNRQIRNLTESIQNGLSLARVEAIRRNAPVRFQLVTGLANSCAISAAGPDWVISLADPSSNCGAAPSESEMPQILRRWSAQEGATNAVVAATQNLLRFNGLGQVTNASEAVSFNITNPNGGDCAARGGPMRCLRVDVTPLGMIRLCDPAATGANPRVC